MAKGSKGGKNISVVGGGGGVQAPTKVTALTAFKENAKQFNEAIQAAKSGSYSTLEYTDITGKTVNRYWDGAKFSDKKAALFEGEGKYKRKGKLKVSFKPPKSWQ